MQGHETHESHTHTHGPSCGHGSIKHGDHVDYAHEGHLHHVHDGHVDECRLEVNARNADACKGGHACKGHDNAHKHGRGCGHEALPHGNHMDYLVSGHLHHQHDGHCDDHGAVEVMGSRAAQAM
jgi:hypothetical protein